jgi:hypothetical protein
LCLAAAPNTRQLEPRVKLHVCLLVGQTDTLGAMAKNDAVLLDGIIDRRLAELLPSGERDEVFEYFVLEETLKDYDFSRDEIEAGWIDGRADGVSMDSTSSLTGTYSMMHPTSFGLEAMQRLTFGS